MSRCHDRGEGEGDEQSGPVVEVRASRWSLADVERARQLQHLADALAEVPSRPHGPGEASPAVLMMDPALGRPGCLPPEASLTPWMQGALAAMRAGAANHTIVARHEWHVRVERTPLMLRVAVVLVSGGAGDYAAYMAISDDDAWIADHGTKLGFTDAALLFPGILATRYRP